MSTEQAVEHYLKSTIDRYATGQPEYYGRIALEQALIAHREGNYGIGAVAVSVGTETISEFPAQNTMFTGVGVVDHAETRALLDIYTGKNPTLEYARNTNEWTRELPEGISVYGSLEPCPMCACTLINAGAKRSISTVLDGNLIEKEGFKLSEGAASVIGDKAKLQPQIWQWLQSEIGLTFELLNTEDEELKILTRRIFEDYRKEVDRRLADRSK
jgi:tRNA(Arg) A34 adenosine deaminase TadA